MFFVTPGHIARLFKKHVGESAVSYINRIRVEKSKKILREGSSVKDAAEQVGFESLNNYYKYFKLHTGMTPAEFTKTEQ
jgi:AraC-like DNA-binding protein